LSRRLTQGSFVGICIVGTHLDDVEAYLFWRCIIETKRLIILLDILKNCKNFFHGCHYYFFSPRQIYKVENKDKKQTKDVGLMGLIS
jgi:hypothetical protein